MLYSTITKIKELCINLQYPYNLYMQRMWRKSYRKMFSKRAWNGRKIKIAWYLTQSGHIFVVDITAYQPHCLFIVYGNSSWVKSPLIKSYNSRANTPGQLSVTVPQVLKFLKSNNFSSVLTLRQLRLLKCYNSSRLPFQKNESQWT